MKLSLPIIAAIVVLTTSLCQRAGAEEAVQRRGEGVTRTPVANAPGSPVEQAQVRRGEVAFAPAADEATAVPKLFQLPAAKFSFTQTPQPGWQGEVAVSLVTFPSPVKTPHANNNTVHCEYFRPAKEGKYPAVVVLHILGGDFALSRTFAHQLAKNGVAALFLKMPYYGERHQPDAEVRMVSADPRQTVAGMTQAVKDIRYAAAWLAAQDEVDPKQLGIFGISLGGITAALATSAEPRFGKCCSILAGGNISDILKQSNERHIAAARSKWLAGGGTLEELTDLLKTIDPCTYGANLKGRNILMLNAKNDEVIPRACTDALWESCGRPTIHWYEAGHYSALLHIVDALAKTTEFFKKEGRMQ